jgi:hypothetical protein
MCRIEPAFVDVTRRGSRLLFDVRIWECALDPT